jgi:hypothetical protein
MAGVIKPFKVAVPDQELAYLQQRLATTRYPDILSDIRPWQDGTDLEYFKVWGHSMQLHVYVVCVCFGGHGATRAPSAVCLSHRLAPRRPRATHAHMAMRAPGNSASSCDSPACTPEPPQWPLAATAPND